ncbi:MAG: hypothetical protein FJ395_15670 [Verrucomicrobia bacterium]|nr:hypothetical protein [Verrucomicrobiota bacterium]
MNRREFIRNSVLATTALAAGANLTAAPKSTLPVGKIGKLNITRLILGGNLLTRYHHSHGLGYVGKLVKSYNTDAKVRETIELAEASGINTLSVNVTPAVCKVLNDHRKNGGKIQWILYSTSNLDEFEQYRAGLHRMATDGTEAIYIWGVHADRYIADGKLDVIAKAVEEIKLLDLPCGLGAHGLGTVQAVEQAKLPVDFYIKTLHHHRYNAAPRNGEATKTVSEVPGYWCKDPDETIAFMKSVAKPWIAFKVMAAGAIPPKDAFPYSFNNGADFILAGMFDFDIEEDCQVTRDAHAKCQKRTRPWRA